jgi:peptide/nickel transport system substrate-binding protein
MRRFLSEMTRRDWLQSVGAGAAGLALSGLNSTNALAAGRILSIAIPNNGATLDPMNQTNHDFMAATHMVFENLLEVDVNGDLQPSLARALPQISADKLTYTFDLRDDVHFQNGDKMTAEDVKYSYEYILDPKNKAVRRGLWTPIREIVVESPTRVRFELKNPYRPWLDYMTKFMGIFPKGSREKYGDDYFKLKPVGVGTGPGMFVEWRQNDYIQFNRNPNYWRKEIPAWDQLFIRTVPEDSVRVAYLLTNQIQIMSGPPARDFGRLKVVAGIEGASKPGLGCMLFMQLNNKKPPFDDINFRKAIAFALDRDGLARDVFYGMLDPSAVPAPASGWWFNKEAAASLAFNRDKAREYLAKSKYAANTEFDLNIPAQPYLIDVRDAAVVIQSQLAEVGIKVNLKSLESNQVIAQNINGTHTASLFPNMGPSDPTYMIQVFYTPDQVQSKSSGYTNPELTAALTESFKYNDRESLKPVYGRIQQILADDSPNIWLGYVHIGNLWRKEVKNFQVNTGLTTLRHHC